MSFRKPILRIFQIKLVIATVFILTPMANGKLHAAQAVYTDAKEGENASIIIASNTFEEWYKNIEEETTSEGVDRRENDCLTVNPDSLQHTMNPEEVDILNLSIINNCLDPLDFELRESAIIFREDLESGQMPPNESWEVIHDGDTSNQWTIMDKNDLPVEYQYLGYEGRYSAWVGYDSDNLSDEWLWSPVININSLTNPYLAFWALSDTTHLGATMEVWVSDEVGTLLSIDPVWDLLRDEVWNSADTYRPVFLDLSAFEGNDFIRIGWHYDGQAGQSFGLDVIEVGGDWDLVWLSPSPTGGTVLSESETIVAVTLNSSGLTTVSYFGSIFVDNAVESSIRVPVTLQINDLDQFLYIPMILR